MMLCLADGVVEMSAERVDRNRLAGDVGDRFDRAVLKYTEDALDLFVVAVAGIGSDEITAAGDPIDDRLCRGRTEFNAVRG